MELAVADLLMTEEYDGVGRWWVGRGDNGEEECERRLGGPKDGNRDPERILRLSFHILKILSSSSPPRVFNLFFSSTLLRLLILRFHPFLLLSPFSSPPPPSCHPMLYIPPSSSSPDRPRACYLTPAILFTYPFDGVSCFPSHDILQAKTCSYIN